MKKFQNRKDRLVAMITLFRDGQLYRAADLSKRFGVSQRSIYRDMETLIQSGVPIAGTCGSGYRMTTPITLPALNLTMEELEVLHIALAVMTGASDLELQTSAKSLAGKIDMVLPEESVSNNAAWMLAAYSFADSNLGVHHIPEIRRAIRNKTKLKIRIKETSATTNQLVVHPLKLEYWGRVWTLAIWCERDETPKLLRVDQIDKIVQLHAQF